MADINWTESVEQTQGRSGYFLAFRDEESNPISFVFNPYSALVSRHELVYNYVTVLAIVFSTKYTPQLYYYYFC
jgi:hypothetical protein